MITTTTTTTTTAATTTMTNHRDHHEDMKITNRMMLMQSTSTTMIDQCPVPTPRTSITINTNNTANNRKPVLRSRHFLGGSGLRKSEVPEPTPAPTNFGSGKKSRIRLYIQY